ncbi:MAG: helix-turn-helix domain-containing protein [Pseudomonadota bacterium]
MSEFSAELKRRRQTQGVSLQNLATWSGVSKSMISKIERMEVQPSLAIASRLAEALGTTLAEMLMKDRRGTVVHIPRNEHALIRAPDQSHVRTILSPIFEKSSVEWLRIEQQPGRSTGVFAPHKPGSEEYVYVSRNQLIAIVGGNSYTLNEGDSLYFEADKSHEFVNPGSEIVEYYVIVKR